MLPLICQAAASRACFSVFTWLVVQSPSPTCLHYHHINVIHASVDEIIHHMTFSHACMYAWCRDTYWATWKAVIGWKTVLLTGQQPMWRACLCRLNNFAQNKIQHIWWASLTCGTRWLIEYVAAASYHNMLPFVAPWVELLTTIHNPFQILFFKISNLIYKFLKI